ncbi:GNS1/SUR4 membrane protein [Imleria badia]|nr:GNS1/SUR4 membrane protein [Imleria badia]
MADILLPVLPSLPPFLTSWIPGQTPMSTWPAVSTAILSYLVVVFGLKELMKDRPAFNLRTPSRIHNIFLSISSLLLFTFIMEEVVKLRYNVGPFNAVCARGSWTSRLEFYYMINYYFKYIEFLDTVLIVLKKRPLCNHRHDVDPYIPAFLHVFHHSTTAFLSFVQPGAKISGVWSAICLNLAVHIMMYYYYFATAGGAKLWWKKHLTTMQILQFIIDIILCYSWIYQHFVFTYWPQLLHYGDCAGDPKVMVFGAVIITTFLGLFVNFYVQTYTKGDGIGKDMDSIQVKAYIDSPGSGRKLYPFEAKGPSI